MDGIFGMECFGRLRLGRVGIMMDYGSTHDGRTGLDLFCAGGERRSLFE